MFDVEVSSDDDAVVRLWSNGGVALCISLFGRGTSVGFGVRKLLLLRVVGLV